MRGLARVVRYMRPYSWMAVLGLVTTVLPVLMELVTPRMVQFVIDQGIRTGDMTAVWQGSGIMLLAAIGGAATTIGQGIARAQISQGIAFDLRNDLFRHIQRFSFANLDRMQTGQLMTRVSSDVDIARMFLSAGLALLLRTLLMVIGSLVMMLILDWRLSLVMITVLALSSVILFWLMRVVGPLFSKVQEKLDNLNTLVQENLAGVRVVKAYVRERHENERFDVQNVDYMEQNIRGRSPACPGDAQPTAADEFRGSLCHLVGRHRRHRGASDGRRVGRFQQLPADWDVAAAPAEQHPVDGVACRGVVEANRRSPRYRAGDSTAA